MRSRQAPFYGSQTFSESGLCVMFVRKLTDELIVFREN